MPSTYTPIATQTLGSATATVTFSSIPSTYTDLVLISNAALASSQSNIRIRFNSDSSNNYSVTRLFADGSSTYSDRATNQSYMDIGYFNTSICTSITNIENYSNSTSNKTSVIRANSTNYVFANVGLWRSISTINAIEISNVSAINFVSGSTFTLYGIKASA